MAVVFGSSSPGAATHYLPLVGMALLAAGILVFRIAIPANQPLALLGAALTGLALGATVAPALFVAGFSLQSNSLQRVFAIIELLRAVAAFMVAPILAHYAVTAAARPHRRHRRRALDRIRARDRRRCLRCDHLPLSGARPQRPDLDGSSTANRPAWYSPPLSRSYPQGPAAPWSGREPRPSPTPNRTCRGRARGPDLTLPTTDPNSPRPRSRRPRPNCRPSEMRSSSASGARRRGLHADRRQALRRRQGDRSPASRRADRRAWGIAGRRGRIPGVQQGR